MSDNYADARELRLRMLENLNEDLRDGIVRIAEEKEKVEREVKHLAADNTDLLLEVNKLKNQPKPKAEAAPAAEAQPIGATVPTTVSKKSDKAWDTQSFFARIGVGAVIIALIWFGWAAYPLVKQTSAVEKTELSGGESKVTKTADKLPAPKVEPKDESPAPAPEDKDWLGYDDASRLTLARGIYAEVCETDAPSRFDEATRKLVLGASSPQEVRDKLVCPKGGDKVAEDPTPPAQADQEKACRLAHLVWVDGSCIYALDQRPHPR